MASTSDGSVDLSSFVPSGDHILPAGEVNPTGDFQRNWGWLLPGVDLRNLGLTPEFDVTAPLAARIWTGLTGQKVNGVMAIDVAGVKQLLAVTGPVVADGQTISADNVEQYLLHDQYVGLSDAAAGGQQRQDALGTLTKAVLHQLQGQSTDLRSLGQAVSSAVAGRNLMMWSSNPVDQAAWVLSGVSGSLAPRSVDVSLINRGGNKLDQYLPVHVAVTTAPSRREHDGDHDQPAGQHDPGRPIAVHRRSLPGGPGELRRLLRTGGRQPPGVGQPHLHDRCRTAGRQGAGRARPGWWPHR